MPLRMLSLTFSTLVIGTIPLLSPAPCAAADETLSLVTAGKPTARLVLIADDSSAALVKRGAEQVADTVHAWSGATLPLEAVDIAAPALPSEPAIVFATLGALQKSFPQLIAEHKELSRAADIDEQGYVCVPLGSEEVKRLFVVSASARGVYNGALYVREFCIDGDRQNLGVAFRSVVRTPKLGGRSAYTLTIWGNECEYTAEEWAEEFKSLARDGIDRIYFWVSGNFPSKRFPQSFKCKNEFGGRLYDTTEATRIGTVDDLQKIVRSAHALGMRIYLGGGLGAWCGTQFITDLEPDTLKIGPKEPSLCPSNAKSRRALVDYYQEVFEAIPEADGLFIESADEIGECVCPQCSREIDKVGSRQFGQAQLSLCQEIMAAVWRNHPEARVAYTIGYAEHARDVAYYAEIQRLSQDPRWEWMEARESWRFPGPGGELQRAAQFSNHVMRWREYYKYSLVDMMAEVRRIDGEGMYGMTMCFSPGYANGSFYKDVPFPAELLPYALTGFVYREATWDPSLTDEDMRKRVGERFFGKDAPAHLADDLWTLREIIRTKKGLKELALIEQHMQAAADTNSPKTAEGLQLMTRAVNDIRKYVKR